MSFPLLENLKFPAKPARYLRSALLLASLSGALLCSGIAKAQPQPVGTTLTKAQADESAYASMLKQQKPLEKTDPEAALAMLQSFGQNHPTLDPAVRVSLLSAASYLANAQLKDKERALQFSKLLMSETRSAVDEGASDFLLARATLVRSHILILTGNTAEGEALLLQPENWNRFADLLGAPNALSRSYGEQAVGLLIGSYEKAGRNAEAVARMEALVKRNPAILVTDRSALVARLSNNLVAADKPKEALGWGKLSFMLAGFDNASIAASTKLLARAWAKAGDLGSLREFTKAQSGDASAKNPLKEIALPPLATDKATQEALSRSAGEWVAAGGRGNDAVSAYVLSGRWLAAMQLAQDKWMQDPQGAAGPQEVGRVFKAADGDTTRGNQFVTYVAGTGEVNPLPEFLKEHATEKGIG